MTQDNENKKPKRALISGICGQDAAYLSELLLEKGYEVFGTDRRISTQSTEKESPRYWRLNELGIFDRVKIKHMTLESYESILQVMQEVRPDEIYHLAANSFVTSSFQDEFSNANSNYFGTVRMLKAMVSIVPYARFYNAGSSEQMGKVQEVPQTELTRFYPMSPYSVNKVASFDYVRLYREMGYYACSGILFNHESEFRGRQFVTRKITANLVECFHEKRKFKLGNLESKRDWGYAREYVVAMHAMLQADKPDDFVIATNETHSIREFLDEAAKVLADLTSSIIDWEDYVEYDKSLLRPAEVDLLIGNPAKAKEKLGWEPKTKFKELVSRMVLADFERYRNGTLKLKE